MSCCNSKVQGHTDHTITDEVFSHLPYAVFSVTFSLIALSIFSFMSIDKSPQLINMAFDRLFHSFHFMHIVFAASGSLLTFFRFSDNLFKGLIVGAITSSFFCMLSDIFIPYVGGWLLGVDMHLHICFIYELANVLPFLVVGLITGVIMRNHQLEVRGVVSLWSHFTHIFISSLASSFYLVGNGFSNWSPQIGSVFVVLLVAVLIPCSLSDVVIPMFFAKSGKK
jgi:hypothetical protein